MSGSIQLNVTVWLSHDSGECRTSLAGKLCKGYMGMKVMKQVK